MPSEVFADETMARGMAMVAVAVDCTKLDSSRRALRGLLNLSYMHMQAAQEPLLGLPDAIAWCWARGGQWAKLVDPMIAEVKTL